MDETKYVILKVLFDFALEVWFSIFRNAPIYQPKKQHFSNLHTLRINIANVAVLTAGSYDYN